MDNDANWQLALSGFASEIKQAHSDQIAEILLYGSRARNEADPLSDIDLLVVVNGAEAKSAVDKRCAQAANRLSLEYDVVISVMVVDERQYRDSFEPLLINVRREGKKVA